MRVLVALVLLVGVARADDEAKAFELMNAAALAKKAARDDVLPERWDACGEAYLAARAHLDAIGNPRAPEMTYDAAICFWQGRSPERALALMRELVRDAPTHRVVSRARLRIAQWREALGDVEGAAADRVRFAKLYPDLAESRDGLWDAVALYQRLGDHAAMDRTAKLWIKLYAAKRRARAAELALHVATTPGVYKRKRDQARALRAWLHAYGGANRALLARGLLAIGEAELEAACPVKVDARGLCLKPAAIARALPTGALATPGDLRIPVRAPVPRTCATGAAPVRVVARDPRGVEEARTALKQAIIAGEAARDEAGAAYGRRAQLALATLAIEDVLGREVPPLATAPGGAPTHASLRAIARWLDDWRQALDRAREALLSPSPRAPGGVDLIATGRAAWLTLAAADMLRGAPVPRTPRGVDAAEWHATYCAQLDHVFEPYRAVARELASQCLARANEAGIVDDARECLAMFERFEGATLERFPQPAGGLVVRDVEGAELREPPTPTPP